MQYIFLIIFINSPIPPVVGAISGTHIKNLKPGNCSSADYLSQKQKYTINTEAVVGESLCSKMLLQAFLEACMMLESCDHHIFWKKQKIKQY